MAIPTHILRAARTYSTQSMTLPQKAGAAMIMGYCCLAFSMPFAGAAVVSRRVVNDKRYADLRPLSFRDCLPGSPLEDYAGAIRR